MEKQTKFNLWYLVIALTAVVLLRDAWVNMNQVQTIPYSEFQHHLKSGELEEIAISNNLIQGKLKKPTADGRTRIVTTRVDPELAKELCASCPIREACRRLEQAGLVTTQKVGRVRTCRLGISRLEQEAAWIERYRQMWAARFDELDKVVAELKRRENSK